MLYSKRRQPQLTNSPGVKNCHFAVLTVIVKRRFNSNFMFRTDLIMAANPFSKFRVVQGTLQTRNIKGLSDFFRSVFV